MIPQLRENRTESNMEMDVKAFTISAKRTSHIFNMLSKQTYSKPIEAVMREYATNGNDAMIEAGTIGTRQLEITLPTVLEPTFRVRDYGTGLSGEQIDEIYTSLGESTKEGTNEQNGMFGIGSKSAYAYTQTWTLVSVVDGVETTYNMFIDDNNIPQRGVMFTQPTDKENGVEIIIPVKRDDINTFLKTARRVYAYFTPAPIVHNVSSQWPIERPKALFSGNGWAITYSGTRSYSTSSREDSESLAVMGNVAYPIDAAQIITKPTQEEKDAGIKGNETSAMLAGYGLHIEFDNGKLEYAISREGLYYTAYTKKNLTLRIEEILDEVSQQVIASFADKESLWEAKQHYRTVFTDMGSLGRKLQDELKGKIFWNGIAIDNDYFQYKGDDTKIRYYSKSWRRSGKLSGNDATYIQAKPNTYLVFQDLPKVARARLEEFAEKTADFDGLYVITPKDDAEKDKFIKEMNFDQVPYRIMSELDKPVATKNGSTNSKHSTKVFKFNRDAAKSYSANSETWDNSDIDMDNGTGVWVSIWSFEARNKEGKHPLSPDMLRRMLDNLETLGVTVPEVYGVKPKLLENKQMGAGWTDLFDWAKAELEKIMAAKNVLQKAVNADELKTHQYSYNSYSWLLNKKDEIANTDSPVHKLDSAIKEMTLSDTELAEVNTFISAYQAMGHTLSQDKKATHSLEELVTNITSTYPMIRYIPSYNRDAQAMGIEYVNMVDSVTGN